MTTGSTTPALPAPGGLFVDASGWAEPVLLNTDHYAEMASFSQSLLTSHRPLVTTDDVLAEVVALLTARAHSMQRRDILHFTDAILGLPQVHIVHVDEAMYSDAWRLLHHTLDKDWPLVDAASFVVMRQRQITDAFSSDRHFSQAGFLRLPHWP